MNLKEFDKLTKRDFENGAVIDDIRKAYQALNIISMYNGMRNDLDAYLNDVYEWAVNHKNKPNPKDFGLD